MDKMQVNEAYFNTPSSKHIQKQLSGLWNFGIQ